MPSSYIAYSIRSKQDNKASDLFNKDDAIMSVANYLKKHGWAHKGFTERQLTEKELENLKTKKTNQQTLLNSMKKIKRKSTVSFLVISKLS